MRKTLCVCLVLVLCLFATGYAEEEATNDVQKLFGKTENGVYENEILGLGFNMDGWSEINEQERATAEQIGKQTDLKDLIEKPETGRVTILKVMTEDGSEHMNIYVIDMGNMASVIEKTGLETFLRMTEIRYKGLFRQSTTVNLELEYTKTSIGEHEYDGMRISCDLMDNHLFIRQIMFIRGNYMYTIAVSTSREEAMLDEILGCFYHLKDSEE